MVTIALRVGVTRMLFVGLVALALFDPTASGASSAVGVEKIGSVTLYPASQHARELTTWSVRRFSEAGLAAPAAEVMFHLDDEGCGGHLGLAAQRQIDLCVRIAMEPGPQRLVLHELAHVWVADNVETLRRRRFLALRGLDAWLDGADAWKQRGVEQAAEIVAWGLGVGSMLPLIEGDTDGPALAGAFRLLTDVAPLCPARVLRTATPSARCLSG